MREWGVEKHGHTDVEVPPLLDPMTAPYLSTTEKLSSRSSLGAAMSLQSHSIPWDSKALLRTQRQSPNSRRPRCACVSVHSGQASGTGAEFCHCSSSAQNVLLAVPLEKDEERSI